ncbi:MAG: hypothetical protein ACI3ZT_02405 [Candidatus Cryptobacteroides sp.]
MLLRKDLVFLFLRLHFGKVLLQLLNMAAPEYGSSYNIEANYIFINETFLFIFGGDSAGAYACRV